MIHIALAFTPSVVCFALTTISHTTRVPDAGALWAWASLIAMVKDRSTLVVRENRRRLTPQLERLTAFLVAHPQALQTLTLTELAREVGATRQFVHMHLPDLTAEQRRRTRDEEHRRIAAFLKRNPRALEPVHFGGVALSKIADAARIPRSHVRAVLREMKLQRRSPTKRERRQAAQQLLERRAEEQRARLSRVLRIESCEICGTAFPWTGQQERSRRHHGAPVSCSRKCSNEYYERLKSRSLG